MKKLLLAALTALAPLAVQATEFTFTYGTTGQNALDDLAHGTAYTWGLSGTTYGGNYNNLRTELQTGGKVITSARLTVNDIRDWANETIDPADALFINILNGLDAGINTGKFDSNSSSPSSSFSLAKNPFVAGNSFNTTLQATSLDFNNAVSGSLLKANSGSKEGTPADVTWSDPDGPLTPSFDLVIDFTAANIAVLQSFLKLDTNTGDPTVGLGFGPECHYFIDGKVQWVITTGNAPTPPPPSVPDSANTLALLGLALVGAVAVRRYTAKRA